MQRLTFYIIFFLVIFTACKSTRSVAQKNPDSTKSTAGANAAAQPAVNFSDQVTWLLGYFNPDQLKREPYSVWFLKGFDEYQPNGAAMDKLSAISKDDLSIKIVMGTWCPDSRREVPRFMRILDGWKFPAGKVTFIGVDNAKLSPVGEYEMLDIQRVPTFIVYKNNIEAGRIIENPVTSLEQDMVNILTGMNKNK
jgi:thiol-disulfide isomerase/thioredoxin